MHDLNTTDYFLDITTEVCPLTFVKAKLTVERMAAGQTLDVRLKAGEPLENVPRSLAELGHEVLFVRPEVSGGGEGVYRMRVRKR